MQTPDQIKKLEKVSEELKQRAKQLQQATEVKFPFLFVGLSTFGLVSTFYGFEKVIDSVPFFQENPEMVLVVGVVTLITTGGLYKKLN